ncbi:hypothetical protein [Butyrivibrio sp. INlla21]|uniref:hypothetical protein n=1 Tax=Butyrivibrio sp. INlla21 TaxID=1520811 RepID=UPI0008EA3958|nr:hypothetical protein [Butyrivibrio sp. INlla21]SFU35939.1 hypothetical protein SAMN02910342_00231 [Butyrivibrio sp. INlla21]
MAYFDLSGGGGSTPPTGTYTATTRAANIDMGANSNNRYLDTTGVPNSNTETYTPTTRAASIDMGATNAYRYVNTNSVPNTNSGTYTFPANDTGGQKDLGVTNTYRYVTATNVYNKGKADGAPSNKNNGLVESSNKTCSFSATSGCIYAITSTYLNTNSSAMPSVTNGTALLNKWCAYAVHRSSDNYSISVLLLVKATSSTITVVAPSGGSGQWHSVAWCKLT